MKDHLTWQFVVSLFIEKFPWISLLSQPMCKIKCLLWKETQQNLLLEWLLWVVSTNLCILETVNFTKSRNIAVLWLLKTHYQLPNMYRVTMCEESAVFRFMKSLASDQDIIASINILIDTLIEENFYKDLLNDIETQNHIKQAPVSDCALSLSLSLLSAVCVFSMLSRLWNILSAMSDKFTTVDF